MTLDELLAREAIRYTMACYHMAGDGNDAEGYAATFTEDGVVEMGDLKVVGRDEIRAWKDARVKASQVRVARHNLTSSQLDLTGPESAKGRSYFTVLTEVGPDHCGVYADVFRKVGDRWLIAHRKVSADWMSDVSRFRPAS